MPKSLDEIESLVLQQVNSEISWFALQEERKARLSKTIRVITTTSIVTAGVLPAIAQLFPVIGQKINVYTGLIALVCTGVAAFSFLIDKVFGISRGSAHYAHTLASLRQACWEFQVCWGTLLANAGPEPSSDTISALVGLAEEFSERVQSLSGTSHIEQRCKSAVGEDVRTEGN